MRIGVEKENWRKRKGKHVQRNKEQKKKRKKKKRNLEDLEQTTGLDWSSKSNHTFLVGKK